MSEALKRQLEDQADLFREQVQGTQDRCLLAKLVALSDKAVLKIAYEKLKAGNLFRGIRCLDIPGLPDLKFVLFDFACPEGVFCIVPPRFVAVVNMMSHKVVGIIDPYIMEEGLVKRPSLRAKIEVTSSGSGYKVKVKAKASAGGSSTKWVTLGTASLRHDGNCVSLEVDASPFFEFEARVCWEGNEICAQVELETPFGDNEVEVCESLQRNVAAQAGNHAGCGCD